MRLSEEDEGEHWFIQAVSAAIFEKVNMIRGPKDPPNILTRTTSDGKHLHVALRGDDVETATLRVHA